MRLKGLTILISVFVFLIKLASAQSCSTNFVSGCSIDQNLTLNPGVYNIESISFSADNVALDCNGAVLNGDNNGHGIFVINRTGIVIKNCNLTNYNHAITSNGNGIMNFSVIENNNIYNVDIAMFLGKLTPLSANTASYNNFIRGNTLKDILDKALVINKFENLTFENNIIDNVIGIGFDDGGLILQNVKESEFRNNSIKNVSPGASGGIFVSLNSSSNQFLRNIITNNIYGIILNTGSRSNLIANNTLNNNINKGIYMQNTYANILLSNTIRFNGLGIGIETPLDDPPGFLDQNIFLNNDLSDNFDLNDQVHTLINETWSTLLSLGNHWGNFDNESEGCIDNQFPFNICDIPKNISDGTLNFSLIAVAKDFFPVRSIFLFAGVNPPAVYISNVTIDESDTVEIFVNATNFAGTSENLAITINDPRFIKADNDTFLWQTNFTDSGNYVFDIDVVDTTTNLHTPSSVEVTINDAANTECGSIPRNSCTITQNTVFNNPGSSTKYTLKDGINVVSSGITLDCSNVTIDGLFYPNPVNDGIKIKNVNNNVIKNCNIGDYYYGIIILNSNNDLLENNILDKNKFNSIRLEGSNFNTLKNLRILNTGINSLDSSAIILQQSSNNLIKDSLIKDNILGSGGIYLKQSSNSNIVTNNTLANNIQSVVLSSSGNNINNNITRNNFLSNQGFGLRFLLGNSNNLAYRNNFIDNGLLFGTNQVQSAPNNQFSLNNQGNYYNNYDEPSEGCFDLNNNERCDSPFTFSNNQDQFPFTNSNGWDSNIEISGTASFGNVMNFTIWDINHPNSPYILAFSHSNQPGIFLPNGITVPLAGGQILIMTIFYGPLIGLTNNVGILDSNGRALAQFSVPIQGLNLMLYTAFVTADSFGNIIATSPSYSFNVQP